MQSQRHGQAMLMALCMGLPLGPLVAEHTLCVQDKAQTLQCVHIKDSPPPRMTEKPSNKDLSTQR